MDAFNYLQLHTSAPAVLSHPIGAGWKLPWSSYFLGSGFGAGFGSWKESSHLQDWSLLCKAALLCSTNRAQRPPAGAGSALDISEAH